MHRMFRIAAGAVAIGAVVLLSGTPADARCARVKATGFGLGPEIAKEFAAMNLEFAIAAKGLKAKGRTHFRCNGPIQGECTASRRAC